MKFLPVPVLLLLMTTASSVSHAATLTVSGNVQFSSLDGSADDTDPTPGVFAYNGDLVIDGSINCNDDPPKGITESACPISIRTTGDLTMDAGSAIYAENRRDKGNGGNITLDVGGNLTLHGPDGSLPGALISSSRTSGAGPQSPVQHAGNLQITVAGTTSLEAGSIVEASAPTALSGSIQIAGQGAVTVSGLVGAGPSHNLDPARFSSGVLTGGTVTGNGGPITITSQSATTPGIAVTATGVVVSQGQAPGAGKVQLEACGIAVRGLVVSLGRTSGSAQVSLRSGKDLLVDGSDLGISGGTRLGRVRADVQQGGNGYQAALYARGGIQVLGPSPAQSTLAAVSSDPSTLFTGLKGGTVTAIALAGGITASGNAFEAGAAVNYDQGGTIDLRAKGDLLLDNANLKAVGDSTTSGSNRHGGTINVRSYSGQVSWTNGLGDVRPVGKGAPSSVQGAINVTYCASDALTGSQFPTVGQPYLPFPVETASCDPAAPSLPTGEPDLPSCGTGTPPTAVDDAYTTDQGKALTVPAPGVLANDSGPGLSVTPQTSAPTAQGGTVTLAADGSFTYTPPSGFGSPPDDSFTYTVTNTGGSATATVRITVTANPKPTVTGTVPASGATNVSAASTVTITFSEPVNVTGSAFKLECPSGTPVGFTVTPASPASSYVLHPSAALPGGATCTVTVVATQVTDVDANQNMAADFTASFGVAISASDDLYPEVVIGNVAVDSNAIAYSVTANDSAGSGATITSYDPVSAHGGSISMTVSGPGIGRFTYNPPAGFQGADSFHYTITNGSASATATVNLNVSGLIWFINNNAAAGDGRLASPFNSLAAFQAVNDGAPLHPGANQTVFLFESGSDYSGPITLLSGQKLVGQDARATLAAISGLTPGASSLAFPATNSGNATIARITSGGDGIVLGQNDTLRGLTVGNCAGIAIHGSGFGTLAVADLTVDTNGAALDLANGTVNGTFDAVSSSGGAKNVNLTNLAGSLAINGGALSGSTGNAWNQDQGTADVTYAGSITSGIRSVSVTNRTGGTLTLSGAISDTGAGIFLSGNTGSAVAFAGALTLATGGNDAFAATGGGTVTATGAGSTVTTTTGTAVKVLNTTIGAAGLQWKSVSAGTPVSGPASGIVLNNTGSSGGLVVNGGGGAGSGGTIQNTGSHGVSLTSTFGPSFTGLAIKNTAGSGVKGTQVTNFSFVNGSVDNSATGGGADESNLAFNTAVSGTENNLSGTVTVTGSSLTNSLWHGIDIQNFSGTVSQATLSGNTLTSSTSAAASKGSGIRLQAIGSATAAANVTRATIANNVITNFPSGAGILAQGGNASAGGPAATFGVAGDGTNVIAITGNQIQGQSSANRLGTSAIIATVFGRGQGNFDVSGNGTAGNPLTNTAGTTILVGGNGDTTSTFNVSNNVIVANNTVASNGIGGGTGVTFGSSDTPDMTLTVSGNSVSATDGNGILTVARGTSGNLKVKIQNNTVAAPLSGVREGIRVDAGNTSSINDSVCLNISGNTSAGSGGVQGIGLRKQGTAPGTNAFGINGMSATASPGVESYVNGLNPAGNGTLLLSATSGFSNCSLP